MDVLPDGPVPRSSLLAAGYRDDEVRRMCGRRGLVAVRPGAYVEPTDERLRTPESRHALAVAAAVRQLGSGAVVSHVSAAVLHGIAVWGVPIRDTGRRFVRWGRGDLAPFDAVASRLRRALGLDRDPAPALFAPPGRHC